MGDVVIDPIHIEFIYMTSGLEGALGAYPMPAEMRYLCEQWLIKDYRHASMQIYARLPELFALPRDRYSRRDRLVGLLNHALRAEEWRVPGTLSYYGSAPCKTYGDCQKMVHYRWRHPPHIGLLQLIKAFCALPKHGNGAEIVRAFLVYHDATRLSLVHHEIFNAWLSESPSGKRPSPSSSRTKELPA